MIPTNLTFRDARFSPPMNQVLTSFLFRTGQVQLWQILGRPIKLNFSLANKNLKEPEQLGLATCELTLKYQLLLISEAIKNRGKLGIDVFWKDIWSERSERGCN